MSGAESTITLAIRSGAIFFIHTDTAMNTIIGHCPLDEPRFFAVRLQEVPLERKKKFGSGDPSPNRPHMEIRIFFIADADGTIMHVNNPGITRFINAGGGRPAAFRYLT